MIFFCVSVWGTVFGETENTLEKAEALITELKFYEALVALEPLLVSDEKSEKQEEALWRANMLCKWIPHPFTMEFLNKRIDRKLGFTQSEKIERLNRLGAGFIWSEPGGCYVYWHGFLERLLERYPNSRWAPIAEYYLIQKADRFLFQDFDKTLKALHAYVKKYAKNEYAEVYLAYLDIARINHGIWACLTYPDDPYFFGSMMSNPFTSEDAEKDKKRASVCKSQALKYYAKFIINVHNSEDRHGALKWYKKLELNERSGFHFVDRGGC